MITKFEATKYDPYHIRLKDWRWEQCRGVILQRDEYKCQVIGCGSMQNLRVHHKHYIQGNMPWEAPLEHLITVCCSCHEIIHETREGKDLSTKKSRTEATYPLRKNFKNGVWCIDPVEPPKIDKIPDVSFKTGNSLKKRKPHKLSPVTEIVPEKTLDKQKKRLLEDNKLKEENWEKELFKYKLRDRNLIYDNIHFHNPQVSMSFIKDGFAYYSGTLKRTELLFKIPLSDMAGLFITPYMEGRQLLKWLI